MDKIWRYAYKAWQPPVWQYFIPWFGGDDEYGRRVAVTHVPLVGFIAIAYRMCKCRHCTATRGDRIAEARMYSRRSDTMSGQSLRNIIAQMSDEDVLSFRMRNADYIEPWLTETNNWQSSYVDDGEDDT
jgi:hypothetical protein